MEIILSVLLSLVMYALFLIRVKRKLFRVIGGFTFPIVPSVIFAVIELQTVSPFLHFDHAIFALVSSTFAFLIVLSGVALYLFCTVLHFLLYFGYHRREKRKIRADEAMNASVETPEE